VLAGGHVRRKATQESPNEFGGTKGIRRRGKVVQTRGDKTTLPYALEKKKNRGGIIVSGGGASFTQEDLGEKRSVTKRVY